MTKPLSAPLLEKGLCTNCVRTYGEVSHRAAINSRSKAFSGQRAFVRLYLAHYLIRATEICTLWTPSVFFSFYVRSFPVSFRFPLPLIRFAMSIVASKWRRTTCLRYRLVCFASFGRPLVCHSLSEFHLTKWCAQTGRWT